MAKKENDAVKQLIENDGLNPCFIITPIGELNSLINQKAQGLINSVIEPVLKEFQFKATPAYKIADSGSINRQVLKNIISNKLVIANLTGLNPNVMYELAVRHAVRLPVIIMAEEGTKLPFDINDQRAIFYQDTLLGAEQSKPKLRAAIKAVVNLSSEQIDNPIYQIYQETSIIKSTTGEKQTFDEYLLQRFDNLEASIMRLTGHLGEPLLTFSAQNTMVATIRSTKKATKSKTILDLKRILNAQQFHIVRITYVGEDYYDVILEIHHLVMQSEKLVNIFFQTEDYTLVQYGYYKG